MPRYLVERRFPEALAIPANDAGAQACLRVVEVNASLGVNWLHSYISDDLETMFCVYEHSDAATLKMVHAMVGVPFVKCTPTSVVI